MDDFQALEDTVMRFLTTLVPIHQLDAAVPEDKHTLLVVHTLAQASLIHLYYRSSQSDPAAHEKCLRAARSCVNIIKHLVDGDFDFLDPIIGVRFRPFAHLRSLSRLTSCSCSLAGVLLLTPSFASLIIWSPRGPSSTLQMFGATWRLFSMA